jgi:hypothetical protein
MSSTTDTTFFGEVADTQAPPSTRSAGIRTGNAGSSFAEGLLWARSVLADPVATSVHASGMSQGDLRDIEQAAGGSTS